MERTMNQPNLTGGAPGEPVSLGERWNQWKRRAPLYRRALREWRRSHGRRFAHRFHNLIAGNRAAGPVSFLVGSAALAVALTLSTLYSPSYSVTLDGEPVGVVATSNEDMVWEAIQTVEETGTSPSDTEGMIASAIDVDGVEVAFAVSEAAEKSFKVSIRTKERADACDIASAFGGGGHSRAAGCRMNGFYEDVVDKLLKAARDRM